MISLLKTPIRVAGALFAAGLLVAAQGAIAVPGTVNYAEGQVSLNGGPIGAKQLGNTEVESGSVLRTGNGKAEMLLTPGVFLRLGDNSAVKMVSPSLTNTRVQLLRGEAMVEVAQLEKENHLSVLDNGTESRIEKKGLYDFNATQPMVAVYDGKAQVQADDHTVEVKKGKELPLEPPAANAKLKPQKFNTKDTDSLYAWSKLRSEYEAQANMASAQTVVVDNPGWWYGTGWYWNPWFDTWAFVPGGGFFYDPFGYGFYSPAYWYYNAPLYYYYPGRVFRGRPVAHGGRIAMPPAAVGGSGVRFGALGSRGGAIARPSAPAPAMRGPAMGGGMMRGGPTGGGGMRGPAMGGGGVRFGSVGRRGR